MLREYPSPLLHLGFIGMLAAASASCASPRPHPTAPPIVAAPAPPPPLQPPACQLAQGLLPLPSPALERDGALPSAKNLKLLVETLADPALHGRSAGSEANRRVAELLAKTLISFGLKPLSGEEPCISFEASGVRDQNVVAKLDSRAHRENTKEIIIGAHYDAQGEAGGQTYPGADDNASGVAVLLETARVLSRGPHSSSFTFIAFGAEERGTLGSRAFVSEGRASGMRPRLMINLDMVGKPFLDGSALRLLVPRANEALGFVLGDRDKEATDALLKRAAQKESIPLYGIPEVAMTKFGYFSDSIPFGPIAPTIFLSDAAIGDYHTPTDTADKIDPDAILRAARLTLAIINEVESEDEAPRSAVP